MTRSAKAPAARNIGFERLLCDAIRQRRLVALRYRDDVTERLFGPDAVYEAPTGKTLVDGMQIQALSGWESDNALRSFEVGRLRSVRLTDEPYVPRPVDRLDERYRSILCSA
jgi:hypothetical protein